MDVKLTFTANGEKKTVTTDADRPLLHVIREDLQLVGTKTGCAEGRCGACAVLVDGKVVLSCNVPASVVDGKKLVTIEGLAGRDGTLHPVQEAFLAEGAFQCGYCTAGMILATVALLAETPRPTDAQIVTALDGHLCRCCGYAKILKAVRRASAAMGGKAQ